MPTLRERLSGPPLALGTWLAIDSTLSAETMGRAGFDAVLLDMQHGGITEATLLPMLQALDATGTPALVRVPWLDPSKIMRAADLGAAGVIVPMVNTAADAEAAVSAIRYPPRGIRSFGPVRRWYSAEGAAEPTLCIGMIETHEGLENLGAIAATPGLDGLLVGPVDLALSLGFELSLEMPGAVLNAVKMVAEACAAKGLICASVSFGLENASRQVECGVTFMTSGSDTMFMRRAADVDLAALRGLGGKPGDASA
ncbi:HpcH/HpaI aldolase family protein [Novosphingobium sp. M1R2S20]|uniref:HpcH/HpaI aldolase/citrate lyase family protein n=1 Tax=Novosphingobium rhizovicinum TaxID=3228928 RepID=A0ABV3R704_9SPHN